MASAEKRTSGSVLEINGNEFSTSTLFAAVSPTVLLECVYYATEDDLLSIMERLAALGADQRAKVLAFLTDNAEGSPIDRL
jgi:hypothetical protein